MISLFPLEDEDCLMISFGLVPDGGLIFSFSFGAPPSVVPGINSLTFLLLSVLTNLPILTGPALLLSEPYGVELMF